jgi:putative ABC transport system permease protein
VPTSRPASIARSHRRNEIGIRMALGAGAAHVLALVAGRGLRPVIAGLVAGMAAAAMLGHLIRSLLFGISSSDPLTIAAVSLTVIAISIVACVLPARTAIRTDVSRVLWFE